MRADHGMTGHQPRAVRNALVALEAVARLGPGITAKELAAHLELPPATVYRLLNVLVGEEYVVRLPGLAGFGLGKRALEFTTAERRYDAGVGPLLSALRGSTGVDIRLATYTADGLMVHESAADDAELSVSPAAFGRWLNASALGKLLLAEHEDWSTLLPQRLVPLTARTLTDPDLIRREARLVAREGYAVQDEELALRRACVAVPVRSASGQLIAGVSASGPREQVLPRHRDLIERLRDATPALAAALPTPLSA